MPLIQKYIISNHSPKRRRTKYIFISGGVMSALGKGVTSASIALLLKRHGFKVCPIKCENYLNVDAGTMNPIEHGDPFLCFDGLEADQDLGNYERFLEKKMGHLNFITMGDLYSTVIGQERKMAYDGEDVEPIPHIVNEIIDRLHQAADQTQADFVIVELGGTVGEYENNNGLYYEAARIINLQEPVAHVHVTYVPVPLHIGEPKTKPAQIGIKQLMTMGIIPDFIVIRSEQPIDHQRKYKFALKFHIDPQNVFSNENLPTIYQVPLHLHRQGLDRRILKHFKLPQKTANLASWQKLTTQVLSLTQKTLTIAIVGKYFGTGYFQLADSYYALYEALLHAGLHHRLKVKILPINSETQIHQLPKLLVDVQGVIVPIGWGTRGVEGKIAAIKYVRENKIPYLGLCYGMQLACVEFAQHVVGLADAHSQEVDPHTPHPIIHNIPFDHKYQIIKGDGVSMRLGTYDCVLKPNTMAYEIYQQHHQFTGKPGWIAERHRHRFEFNNAYRAQLEKHGLVFSGTSPDDFFVEVIELPQKIHPFFLATQFHPEYQTYPLHPHPIFIEFIHAALNFS